MKIKTEKNIIIEMEEREARELMVWVENARKQIPDDAKYRKSVFLFYGLLNEEFSKDFPRLNSRSF